MYVELMDDDKQRILQFGLSYISLDKHIYICNVPLKV